MSKLYNVLDELADRTLQHDDDIEHLEEVKADKAVVSMFDKRIKYIYENSHGQEFDIENDTEEAYEKDVPHGGMAASVNMIGGKSLVMNQMVDDPHVTDIEGESYSINNAQSLATLPDDNKIVKAKVVGGKSVVWNQLVQNGNFSSDTQWTAFYGNANIQNGILTFTVAGNNENARISANTLGTILGHKYYARVSVKYNNKIPNTSIFLGSGGYSGITETITETNKWIDVKGIFVRGEGGNDHIVLYLRTVSLDIGDTIEIKNLFCVDLSNLYGEGNEPSTTDDQRIQAIEDYLSSNPEYNAGEIVSADCDKVVSEGKNIPLNLKSTYTLSGINFTKMSETEMSVVGTSGSAFWGDNGNSITLKAGTYTIKADSDKGAKTGFQYALRDSANNDIVIASIGSSATFTLTSDTALYFRIRSNASVTYNDVLSIQLEKGSSATSYSPYMTDSFEIPTALRTAHPLMAAPNIYDDYNIEDMKGHQKVGMADFETLTFTYSTGGNGFWYAEISGIYIRTSGEFPNIISEKYKTVRASTITNGTANVNSIGQNQNYVYIYNGSSTEEPTGVILYELATPVEYDISSYFPSDFSPELLTENGGSVTFHQTDTEFPIPYNVEFEVTSAEPAGTSYRDSKNYKGGIVHVEGDAYEIGVPTGNKFSCVNEIGGKSVVWNQYVQRNAEGGTFDGITVTVNADGTYTFDGTATNDIRFYFLAPNHSLPASSNTKEIGNHKYFTAGCPAGGSISTYYLTHANGVGGFNNTETYADLGEGKIGTLHETGLRDIAFGIVNGTTISNLKVNPSFVDLTTMYGEGNEPSLLTDERIVAIRSYLANHPEYNAGEIVSADVDEPTSVGFNIWDEVLEGGYYDLTTGEPKDNGNRTRSKNYIRIDPNTAYYTNAVVYRVYYGADHNFVSSDNGGQYTFTTPANAVYMMFWQTTSDLPSNIVINISQPDTTKTPHNGQYLPYMSSSMSVPSALRTAHPLHSANEAVDEYNFDRKYTKVAVGSYTFTGSEYWDETSYETYASIPYFTANHGVKQLTVNAITSNGLHAAISGVSSTPNSFSFGSALNININGSAAGVRDAMIGKTLYFELATPIYYYDPTSPELAVNGGTVVPDATHIVDPESYFPVGSPLLNAESGGSLIFHQTETEFPIENSVSFKVDHWNQPIDTTHKYFFDDNGTKYILSNQSAVALASKEDNLVDLTRMFGSGQEPAAVDAAYAAGLPEQKMGFNSGEVVSADVEEVKTTGFNLWDEEWEVGRYNTTTGIKENDSSKIRCKNKIPVKGGSTIYVHCGTENVYVYIFAYDIDNNFINYWSRANSLQTMPANAAYLTFECLSDYGVTYKHDICINVSQTDTTKNPHNGQYVPYFHDEIAIPQQLREDYPLLSALAAKDEYNFSTMKGNSVIDGVDLGTLNWTKENDGTHWYFSSSTALETAKTPADNTSIFNGVCGKYQLRGATVSLGYGIGLSMLTTGFIRVFDEHFNDAASFKAAMNGITLYYELTEPVEIDISSYFEGEDFILNCEEGGKLTFAQEETKIAVPNDIDFLINTDAASI